MARSRSHDTTTSLHRSDTLRDRDAPRLVTAAAVVVALALATVLSVALGLVVAALIDDDPPKDRTCEDGDPCIGTEPLGFEDVAP